MVEFAPDTQRGLHACFGAKADLERLLERDVDLIAPDAVRNPYVLAGLNRHREAICAA